MATIVAYISLWAVAVAGAASDSTTLAAAGAFGMVAILVKCFVKASSQSHDGPGSKPA